MQTKISIYGQLGGTASIFANGDVIGVLYNSDLGQMVVSKNDTLVGTPHATGVIGSIPVEVLICLQRLSVNKDCRYIYKGALIPRYRYVARFCDQ